MTPEEAAEIQANEIVRLGRKIEGLKSQMRTAVQALQFIANHVTSDQIGQDIGVIKGAHDNMIDLARSTLDQIKTEDK